MKVLDSIVAVMLAGCGLAAVLYSFLHKKRVSERVAAGDIPEAQGRKEVKTFRLCSYGVLVIGVGLLCVEALGS